MRSLKWALVAVWALGALGCGEQITKTLACQTGDRRPCMCDAGLEGTRLCANGEFGECVCTREPSKQDAEATAPDLDAGGSAKLEGRVFDAKTGDPIAGADVQTDDGDHAITKSDGAFTLRSSSKSRTVTVSGGDLTSTVEVSPKDAGYIALFVKRIDTRLVFDADEGVVAETSEGTRIEIPAKAVRDQKGAEVKGPVTLEVTTIDGKERTEAAALPGDGRARNKEGKTGQPALAGAVEVRLRDSKGEDLTVDEKANAVAQLSTEEADAPLTRSTFSYNEKSDEWKEEEPAKRTVDDKGRRVYRIHLAHLSWWAYGDFFEKVSCFKVCVQASDGAPVPSAQVWLVGSSFPGTQALFSEADGCVEAKAPAGETLVMSAESFDLVSESKAFQVPEAGDSCGDAGKLALQAAKASACPSGFVRCDDRCVDLATSRAHCGACGQACKTSDGRSETCVAGTCSCVANQTSCGSTTLCANVARDREVCGACGVSCSDAEECIEGVCVDAGCDQGRLRCGTECVDVNTTALHCGACDNACKAGQQCSGGKCVELTTPGPSPTGCASGFDECDGNLATVCETKLNTVQHCGSCDNACSANHAVSACQGGACVVASCESGYGDCDTSRQNGCETNLANTIEHCGKCDTACVAANGFASCTQGVCGISACDTTHADCDKDASNGCETDTRSLRDCGACGSPCSVENGSPSCTTGTCQIGSCGTGFDDCDKNATNGCEVDLHTLNNCGACGVPCARANGTASCASGACQLVGCTSGYEDCDQNTTNGCESHTASDATNCGECGIVCSVPHGTPGCSQGGCVIASCDAGFDDCDGDPSNGCETDLSTINDCGSCDHACTVTSGIAGCNQGACIVAGCNAGFDDCDQSAANGCEVNLRTLANCGVCGQACTVENGSPTCQSGTCAVQTCSSGFGDCDNAVATGCETNLNTAAADCGECGRDCAAASASCSSGMCSVTTLYSGRPYGSDNSGSRSWSFNGTAAFHLGFNSYTVERLPIDGSGVVSVYAPTNKTGGIESIWSTDTAVYWAERGTPSVVLTKLHSAAPSDLPTLAWTPTYQPTFLRIQDGNWYWASGDYQSGDPGGYIYKRPVDANATDPGTRIVSVDQGNHGAILGMTTTSDALYWITSGVYNSGYQYAYYLHTTPLSGGTPTPIAVPGLNTAAYSSRSVSLQSRGNTLYFNVTSANTSFLNGIYRYATGDSAPTQLVSADNVTSLILDGPYIYFMQLNVSGVFRAPITGGTAVKVAPTSGTRLLGADSTYLYMAVSTCCQTSLSRVVK